MSPRPDALFERGIYDAVRDCLHHRINRKHPGHLRGIAFFEHANRNKYVHFEFGHSRRMLPDWHPISDYHHEYGPLDFRTCNVQGIYG